MADVPFATNLLSAIDPYIATARGTDLSWIGNLPDSYWAGQNQANVQAQRDIFKNGIPPNAGAMIDALARVQGAGAAPSIMQYYKMLYGRQADVDVNPPEAGGTSAPSAPLATRIAPPSTESGIVSSTPTVVGDREGAERGLYAPPVVPGARPPIQPDAGAPLTFRDRFAGDTALPPNVVRTVPIPAAGNTAQEIAAPALADPTLGGLIPRGRTPQQQLRLLQTKISEGMLEPEVAKGYQEKINAIQQALQQYRQGAIQNAELPQEVKTARAAGFANPLDFERAKAQQAANVAQETKQYEEATKDYKVAQVGQYRLGLINDSIKSLGPQWMGTGANFRANAAKTYNSFRDLLPTAVRNETPQFDPKKIASWEDFNKQTMNLGFELARTLGSREAQQIVKQATSSVPGALQTYWGARLVSASMGEAFQRSVDYREFLRTVPPGQRLDADVAFNKLHPVSEYVKRATSVVPSEPAIQFLRDHPDTRAAFDEKYRDGASVGVFGAQ